MATQSVSKAPAITPRPNRAPIGSHVILSLLGILTFVPFVVMLMLSVKSMAQFHAQRWVLSFPFHWENYIEAWTVVSRYISNSIIISGVSAIGVITFGSLTAYALARFDFPGRQFFYYAIISLMMIPPILTLVPLFVVILRLGLVNSWWGLWGPYVAGGQIFVIFVMRAFFAGLPEELFEAARLDGASELHSLWHVALPLSKPMIFTLALLNILSTWNEFVWPLMVIRDTSAMPLTVGLMFFQHNYYTNWGPLFAGYTLAALPMVLLFAFTSKQFIAGLTSGAMKM